MADFSHKAERLDVTFITLRDLMLVCKMY